MQLSKLVASVTFLTASAAQGGTVKFQGSCLSNVEEAEAQTFDLEISPAQKLALPIVEIDGFGNEVVTNVLVSFPISSLLAVRFSTDLPAPFNGDVSSFGVTTSTNLRALFPLHLGGQVACSGTVRE